MTQTHKVTALTSERHNLVATRPLLMRELASECEMLNSIHSARQLAAINNKQRHFVSN